MLYMIHYTHIDYSAQVSYILLLKQIRHNYQAARHYFIIST